MYKKLFLLFLGTVVLASCGTTAQHKVSVNPTVTPLTEIQQSFVVPKLKVSKSPDYVPAKFIRVYRCSYTDGKGNVVKGAFMYVKIRNEQLKASF